MLTPDYIIRNDVHLAILPRVGNGVQPPLPARIDNPGNPNAFGMFTLQDARSAGTGGVLIFLPIHPYVKASSILQKAHERLGDELFVVTTPDGALVNPTLQSSYGLEFLGAVPSAEVPDPAYPVMTAHNACLVHLRLPSMFDIELTFAVRKTSTAESLLQQLRLDPAQFCVATSLNQSKFAEINPSLQYVISASHTYVLAPNVQESGTAVSDVPLAASGVAAAAAPGGSARTRKPIRRRAPTPRRRSRSSRRRALTPHPPRSRSRSRKLFL